MTHAEIVRLLPSAAITALPALPFPRIASGKVRDIHDLGDALLLVATDRLSAFDVILPDGIPGKGIVLTQLSLWWFARTADLIPLCHPVLVGAMLVNFRIEDTFIEVESQVETVDRTGVEMEALTATTVACLTIYDMCKSVDRAMVIGDIALWEKTGGRSGTFQRAADGDDAFDVR